jgi:hypothetical protein
MAKPFPQPYISSPAQRRRSHSPLSSRFSSTNRVLSSPDGEEAFTGSGTGGDEGSESTPQVQPDAVETPQGGEGAWFLNLDKPLLSQLIMSKQVYLDGILSPAFPTATCRLFGFWPLEMLSRTPWWLVPLVWLPVVVTILVKATEEWPPWSVHMLSAAGVPELVQVPVTDVV